LFEHGGYWQGFAAYIGRYPDDRLCVAVLCNRTGARAGYIAKRVAGFYVPTVAPRTHTVVRLNPGVLSSYASDYGLEDRFTIKVTVAGDPLETTWLSEKITLVPESDTVFFGEDSDRTFRFAKVARGTAT